VGGIVTAKAKAIHAADKAFSLYIRARDRFCVTCGQASSDCSHIFSRSHYATRWDENNSYGQCRGCHMRHHNQTESYLLDYAKGRLGKKRYEDMRKRWESVSNWKAYQIDEVARYYRGKLR
jgi:5-methylcytosine-specific restriction endonuclease McrA